MLKWFFVDVLTIEGAVLKSTVVKAINLYSFYLQDEVLTPEVTKLGVKSIIFDFINHETHCIMYLAV